MRKIKLVCKVLLVLLGCVGAAQALAVDVAVEAGLGVSADASDTYALRVAMRDRAYGDPRGWSLWWEASVGGWRYEVEGDTKHLVDIAATPLLRYIARGQHAFFAEAGVGIHYLSRRYQRGDHQFSTRVQFSPQVGVGYRFEEGGELVLRFQHLSNAGLKQPNAGVELLLLSVSKAF